MQSIPWTNDMILVTLTVKHNLCQCFRDPLVFCARWIFGFYKYFFCYGVPTGNKKND